jgi:hypothetical protein
MLISHHPYRFIFIHVYKNAGTSISAALRPYIFSPFQFKIHSALGKFGISAFDPEPYPEHIRASELAGILGMERFRSYFSFAVVRNPWDWQVSLYNYMLKTPEHYQHELVKKLDGFEAYLHWRCTEDVKFQKDFVFSPDAEQLVDFIGRYERLDQDFSIICSKIGIAAALPRLNVSKSKPYQDYYTRETIELVRNTFAADIALFGYDFD